MTNTGIFNPVYSSRLALTTSGPGTRTLEIRHDGRIFLEGKEIQDEREIGEFVIRWADDMAKVEECSK